MSADQRKEGAKALRDEALLRATLEAAVNGIVTIDSRGCIRSVNPSACSLFGYEEEDLLGKNVRLLMPTPYREEHDTYLHNYRSTGKKKIIGIGRRVTGLRRDGTTFPLHLSVGEAHVEDEHLFVGVLHDLTDQVRADDLSRIIDDSLNEIYIFDALTLKFKHVNRGGRENLGYSCEELMKLTAVDIKPEFSLKQFADIVEPLQSGIEERIIFETVHERKDETRYSVEVHLQMASLGGAPVFVAMILDTTRRKEIEERTRRLEELASVATLTAGIAHDVGTPMSVILGYAGLLQRSIKDEKVLSQLGIIVAQVERVSNLVGTLLNFAGPRESVRQEVDLATVLDASISFFQEKLKRHSIGVERDFAAVPPIQGDAEKIQQVFMNLLLNAIHAMPDGGTLLAAIGKVGDQVEVRVRDDGTGMNPKTLEQIFDPFFTTKDRGEGTGLGLVVTRNIILDHEGTVSATSEPGIGTEFQIRFPIPQAKR
jgi:PAS domain S-box-containing protein